MPDGDLLELSEASGAFRAFLKRISSRQLEFTEKVLPIYGGPYTKSERQRASERALQEDRAF